MSFARMAETEGSLTVVQTNHAALRDLWVSLKYLLPAAALFLLVVLVVSHLHTSLGFSWHPDAQQDHVPSAALFVIWVGPALWMVLRSVNRLCGSRTFRFDQNREIFFYNGFPVGPLQEIRAVKTQVRNGMGQNPMFRLVLELPSRRLTMIVLETYYIPAPRDFVLTRNAFSDPNKRFAIFEDWLDCDKQNLISFVPQEIGEVQQKIIGFLSGYGVKVVA